MKKISNEDIDTILLAGKIIYNVGRKYGIKGNLNEVFDKALAQFKYKFLPLDKH